MILKGHDPWENNMIRWDEYYTPEYDINESF